MLARSAMVVVLGFGVAACVDDSAQPPTDDDGRDPGELIVEVENTKGDNAGVDVCVLAAKLPSDDICSLVCDYEAFKQRAIDNGMQSGACYSFRCSFEGGVSANVGVCAP